MTTGTVVRHLRVAHGFFPFPSSVFWRESRHVSQTLLLLPALCLALVVFSQPVRAERVVTVLVAYHSVSGHTERMARAVAEGVQSVPGIRVQVERVEKVTAETLFAADALVVGSPVYWANMAGP